MAIDVFGRGMVVMLAALAAALGAAGEAAAVPVTFSFSAVGQDGSTASGYFAYDTDQGPSWASSDMPGFGGGADYSQYGRPVGLGFAVGDIVHEFRSVDPRYFFEYSVHDNVPHDAFYLNTSAFASAPDDFRLTLTLRDDSATAFGNHLALPTILDLERFNVRTISASVTGPDPTRRFSFIGTITSLWAASGAAATPSPAAVPEPASIVGALLGLAAVGGGRVLARRRRAAA